MIADKRLRLGVKFAGRAKRAGCRRIVIAVDRRGWSFQAFDRDGKIAESRSGIGGIIGDREPIPKVIREAVIKRDGMVCAYCGSEAGPWHIDHIHPVSRGGTDEIGNLTVACALCNLSKGDRLLSEWSPRNAGADG